MSNRDKIKAFIKIITAYGLDLTAATATNATDATRSKFRSAREAFCSTFLEGDHLPFEVRSLLAQDKSGAFLASAKVVCEGNMVSRDLLNGLNGHLSKMVKLLEESIIHPSIRTGTVFYSWQSDSENAANRGFIQDALELAIPGVQSTPALQLDHDTRNVPGAPDITAEILRKIDAADIYVADVTLTMQNTENGKWGPNSNVLVELGYALGRLGTERVLLVLNEAIVGKEHMPFDLGTKRLVLYNYAKGQEGKGKQVKNLAERLELHLQLIVNSLA
jgi:hypothetical protein